MTLNRAETLSSYLVLGLLVLCTVYVMVKGDALWSAIGIWAIVVTSVPMMANKNFKLIPRPYFIFLYGLPLFIATLHLPSRVSLREIAFSLIIVLTVAATFLLSLATLIQLRAHLGVKMNRPFFIASAVILFIASLGLYVVLLYVRDLLNPLEPFLVNNDDLMMWLTMLTFGGLVMGILLDIYLHTTSLDELQRLTVGEVNG
ncbi:MAG: hypothetical protein QW520_08850 [Methanomassiliicoccales archaeon]